MSNLRPLPDAAVAQPLTLLMAAGYGVGPTELSGPLWQRLARGVRGWNGLEPDDPDVRIRSVALQQPPGTVLGGWAALRMHGLRDLDGRTGPGACELERILVHVGPSGRTRPGPHVDVDRGELRAHEIEVRDGVQIVTPTVACVAIARRYGAEEGLVVADLATGRGLTDAGALQSWADANAGACSVRSVRQVASLVDPAAASMPESRLRYVWVVDAGLPRPLVNPRIRDRAGYLVGKPDLLDPEAALVGEYDGSGHRELAAHTADNCREERFEGMGLFVVRASALDLWPGRAQLVTRLRAARSRGMARDRAGDLWRCVR